MSTETPNTEHSTPNTQVQKKRFKFSARGVCASGNKFSCDGTVTCADAMEAVVLAEKCIRLNFGEDTKANKIDVTEQRSTRRNPTTW